MESHDMPNGTIGESARWTHWMLKRNPFYILSALMMAIGARMFLFDEYASPGEIASIALTLALLQAYEWAVTAVLLLLHRAKRSPEDKPALMLVAALFWTGPLAATVEMSAARPGMGFALAVGAAIIAVGEFQFVRRLLGLRFNAAARWAIVACIVLLAGAPPLLKVPESAGGTNELFLYAAWWILAAIAISLVATLRRNGPVPAHLETHDPQRPFHETVFLAMTIFATAVHLVGMNHAFFCHARLFYASPLLIALSVAGMELAHTVPRFSKALLTLSVLGCVAGVIPSLAGFHSEVPVEHLPGWAVDPRSSVLLLAGGACLYGFLRHRVPLLLHGALAASMLGVLILVHNLSTAPASPAHDISVAISNPKFLIWGAYISAAYLLISSCIRRSRREAVAAVLLNLAGTVVLVGVDSPRDTAIVVLATGWTALACAHLSGARPGLKSRVTIILTLMFFTWICESDPSLRFIGRSNAAALIGCGAVAGLLWPWTRFVSITIGVLCLHLAFYSGTWATRFSNPKALVAVAGAFALLAVGGLVSWHKQRLLRQTAARPPESPSGQSV